MAAAPALRESEIQQAILNYLRSLPGVFAKKIDIGYIPGRTSTIKGMWDILAIIRQPDGSGSVWFVEVKRPDVRNHKNGGLSDEQVEFGESWRACGGNAIVAHSVEEVIRALPLPQADFFVSTEPPKTP